MFPEAIRASAGKARSPSVQCWTDFSSFTPHRGASNLRTGEAPGTALGVNFDRRRVGATVRFGWRDRLGTSVKPPGDFIPRRSELDFKIPDIRRLRPRITVFGVGGAGGKALNNMINAALQGVDFVVANTDAQALGKQQF